VGAGATLVLLALLLAPAPVPAAEWGTIAAGTSTLETVRAQYGTPTHTARETIDGYETARWVYEGAQAPAGIRRLVVDFGLLVGTVFRSEIVRSLTLEPAPGVFTRETILAGWGAPTAIAPPDQPPVFFYAEGLLVFFDGEGWQVERMVFTPPQH
jgi:hypothetical protein